MLISLVEKVCEEIYHACDISRRGAMSRSVHQPAHFLNSESYVLPDFSLQEASNNLEDCGEILCAENFARRYATRLAGAVCLGS